MFCLLCDSIINDSPTWKSLVIADKDNIICENCSNKFKRADVSRSITHIDELTSLYVYNEMMQHYLHQYKFLQDIALAPVFKNQLTVALNNKVIVPIPVHRTRAKERTFSHIEQLLIDASLPYESLLQKLDDRAMGEKTKIERIQTTQLFTVTKESPIKPITYTLVDDIITTGTTLQHAAKALKKAGATTVNAITLIQA